MQPSDLRLNAYRSLPGDQDILSLLFSCIYIYRNPRKRLNITLKYDPLDMYMMVHMHM